MENEQLRFPSPSILDRVTVWVGNTAKSYSLFPQCFLTENYSRRSTISAEYQYRWENDIKKWYETEGKKFSKYDIQSAKNKKYGY